MLTEKDGISRCDDWIKVTDGTVCVNDGWRGVGVEGYGRVGWRREGGKEGGNG